MGTAFRLVALSLSSGSNVIRPRSRWWGSHLGNGCSFTGKFLVSRFSFLVSAGNPILFDGLGTQTCSIALAQPRIRQPSIRALFYGGRPYTYLHCVPGLLFANTMAGITREPDQRGAVLRGGTCPDHKSPRRKNDVGRLTRNQKPETRNPERSRSVEPSIVACWAGRRYQPSELPNRRVTA